MTDHSACLCFQAREWLRHDRDRVRRNTSTGQFIDIQKAAYLRHTRDRRRKWLASIRRLVRSHPRRPSEPAPPRHRLSGRYPTRPLTSRTMHGSADGTRALWCHRLADRSGTSRVVLSKQALRWPAFQRVGIPAAAEHLSRFGVRHRFFRIHIAGHAIDGARQVMSKGSTLMGHQLKAA